MSLIINWYKSSLFIALTTWEPLSLSFLSKKCWTLYSDNFSFLCKNIKPWENMKLVKSFAMVLIFFREGKKKDEFPSVASPLNSWLMNLFFPFRKVRYMKKKCWFVKKKNRSPFFSSLLFKESLLSPSRLNWNLSKKPWYRSFLEN